MVLKTHQVSPSPNNNLSDEDLMRRILVFDGYVLLDVYAQEC